MKAKDFPLHKLAKLIGGKKAQKQVRKQFHKWVDEVEDLELVRRGRQLWNYLNSGKVSHTEKAVLLLALLYLVLLTSCRMRFPCSAGWTTWASRRSRSTT